MLRPRRAQSQGVAPERRLFPIQQTTVSDTEAIDAIIGDRCDPAPQYAVERVELPDVGKTVMLVRVQRGLDPPYTINGTIFIRVGATDRRASRAELDRLKVPDSGERTVAGW